MDLHALQQVRPGIERALDASAGGSVRPAAGGPTVAELFDSLPMFGVQGGVVPLTSAAERALVGAPGVRLRSIIEGMTTAADDATPGLLRGVTMGGRDDALALDLLLHHMELGDPWPAAGELVDKMQDASKFIDGNGGYNTNVWIDVAPDSMALVTRFIANPDALSTIEQARLAQLLLHEAFHTSKGRANIVAEEGIATLLARWAGVHERFWQHTGLGGVDDATRAAFYAWLPEEYRNAERVVRSAVEVAGLDLRNPGHYPRALELLRPEVSADTPRLVGEAVRRETGDRRLARGVEDVLNATKRTRNVDYLERAIQARNTA